MKKKGILNIGLLESNKFGDEIQMSYGIMVHCGIIISNVGTGGELFYGLNFEEEIFDLIYEKKRIDHFY